MASIINISTSSFASNSESTRSRLRDKHTPKQHPTSAFKQRGRSTERSYNYKRSPSSSRSPSKHRCNSIPRPRPRSAGSFHHRKPSPSSPHVQGHKGRSRSRPFSANLTTKKKMKVWNRWYTNKDNEPKKLQEGEVFSPILWRKFHIDEHLFDIPSTENEISKQELKDNFNKIKMKYPHLTKQLEGSNGMTDHREKVLREGYHRTSRFDASEDNNKQKHLWQRHVDMMKVSKSTSYFNFLSHFDRQSCRACSHSKTCSSKHCSSCDCGTKCEKHSINIDFLRYIPGKADTKQEDLVSNKEMEKKVKPGHIIHKKSIMCKKPSQQNLSVTAISSRGYTMQGFTIMRKTPEMERKTLLSQHIEGQQCTSGKSSNKKCLACAFAKENVLMQHMKPQYLQISSPNRTARQISKKHSLSNMATILY